MLTKMEVATKGHGERRGLGLARVTTRMVHRSCEVLNPSWYRWGWREESCSKIFIMHMPLMVIGKGRR
jgi:hypothetical protein